MKAVMLSIQPKWCELIASGKKTIEVRKTRPKLQTPFKCYIYATVGAHRDVYRSIPKEPLFLIHRENEKPTVAQSIAAEIMRSSTWELCNSTVIGEFVCDKVEKYDYFIDKPLSKLIKGEYRHYLTCNELERTCLSAKELEEYLGEKGGYGWHISDLKIYDKPKELGEFRNLQGQTIKRPFQSWGYVCSNE